MMRTISAWLVERGHPEGFTVPEYVESQLGPVTWTTDANLADKFAEREHAEEVIRYHGLTARAVEHGFMSRSRQRIELGDGAYMDVCLHDDASAETLAALKQIGEAALARMKDDEDRAASPEGK